MTGATCSATRTLQQTPWPWWVTSGLASGLGSAVAWLRWGRQIAHRRGPAPLAPHEAHWASGPLPKEDLPGTAP